MSKKDPFPNDWDEVYNMDDEDFQTPAFIEVIEDSSLWILPEPYCCVLRAYNRKENKLKEYAYRRDVTARQKVYQLAKEGHEVTVMTPAVIAVINYPEDDTPTKRKRQRK